MQRVTKSTNHNGSGSGRLGSTPAAELQQLLDRAQAHALRSREARRWLRAALVMPALALPFSGCTLVGPDFLKPSAPVADSYTGVDGKPSTTINADDAKPSTTDSADAKSAPAKHQEIRAWWTVYNDPILNQLIDTAYNQNLTLRSAGTHVMEARAVVGIAIGGLYPQQQEAAGGVSYNRLSKVDALTLPGGTANFWRTSLGLQSAWELDFWGKFRRGIESADDTLLESVANYDDVLVTLLGNVATTYIGIRTLEKQIAIANDNIATQRKGLSIAQDRFQHGATSRLDVYQAQNVLAATQARVPQLELQRQEGLNVLHVLLGTPPASLEKILGQPSAIPTAPQQVDLGIPADLLRRRPDIRAAELRAASQSAQIGVAKADLYPSFTLVGNIGGISSTVGTASLSDLFTAKAVAYSFGPSVQWPIFNYGRITNNVRVQDARLQALLVDYQNTVLKAQQEVEDGIAGFVLSRDQGNLLRDSVTAAAGALSLAFTQYQEGLTDFTTVLTAEENLLDAQNNYTVAVGATATNLAAIYRALGGGWEIRDGKDFVPQSTKDEMKARTNWGNLLQEQASEPQPTLVTQPASPEKGLSIRAPKW